MKTILLLVSFFVFSSFGEGDNLSVNDIVKIEIHRLNRDRTLLDKPTCGNFEFTFRGQLDTVILTDDSSKQCFIEAIQRSKKAKPFKLFQMEKVYVQYKGGKTDTLCIDLSNRFYLHHQPMTFPNEEFKSLIERVGLKEFPDDTD